jgi:hypothetical protein
MPARSIRFEVYGALQRQSTVAISLENETGKEKLDGSMGGCSEIQIFTPGDRPPQMLASVSRNDQRQRHHQRDERDESQRLGI